MTDEKDYDGTSSVSNYVDITQNKHGGNPQSQKANVRAARKKPRHRDLIANWFRENGPAIAEQVLAVFPQWRYSTVTARISELRRDGILIQVGVRKTKYSSSDAALLKYQGPSGMAQPLNGEPVDLRMGIVREPGDEDDEEIQGAEPKRVQDALTPALPKRAEGPIAPPPEPPEPEDTKPAEKAPEPQPIQGKLF